MTKSLRVLFVGDVVGQPGMTIFQRWIPKLKEKYALDAVIVNGENSNKTGKGIIPKAIDFFKHNGASVITTGNHVWEQRDVYMSLNQRDDIIRPANYPPGCPGKGHTFFYINEIPIAVINLMGRVFTRDPLDCPFRTVESLLTFIHTKTNIIFVDFHAEATSEKNAMGIYLDGKVSGVFGTHTHVQTADERILPDGTGFITDAGSCGPLYSVIGMQHDVILQRFLTYPRAGKFVVQTQGPVIFSGVWVQVSTETGKAEKIERVYFVDDTISSAMHPAELA